MLPQIALVVGLAVVIGGPPGFIYWRKTRRRAGAFRVGLASAALGLIIVAFVYYTRVLCPAGAGCA